MTWISTDSQGLLLTLRVVPRASRNEIARVGDGLKIRLQAPPVDDKANKALIEFLAETLDIPRRCVALVAGQTSRQKKVRITGIAEQAVRKALG